MIQKFLAVALGGSIGAVARYVIFILFERLQNHTFPWATLAVNLIGSFLIGLLWGYFGKNFISPGLRMFIFVGILGSFTTYSAFAFDVFSMSKDGEIKQLLLYILATNFFGIGLAFTGFYLIRLY